MNASSLPLRDVHLPPAPSWWPPAPGWWGLALLLVAVLVAAAVWWRRRQRRLAQWQALFDAAWQDASTPVARLAAASALLRRAARRVDPAADRLQGEAWLRFLDGRKGHAFSEGPGKVLLDGGFRADVAAAEGEAARVPARARFVQLMAGRR